MCQPTSGGEGGEWVSVLEGPERKIPRSRSKWRKDGAPCGVYLPGNRGGGRDAGHPFFVEKFEGEG